MINGGRRGLPADQARGAEEEFLKRRERREQRSEKREIAANTKGKPNANTRTLPPSPRLWRDKPPRQAPGRVVIVARIAPHPPRDTVDNAATARAGLAPLLGNRGLEKRQSPPCRPDSPCEWPSDSRGGRSADCRMLFCWNGGFLPKAATLASAPFSPCRFSRTAPRNLLPEDAERDSLARPRPNAASRADE